MLNNQTTIFKNHTIIAVLDPGAFVTSKEHTAFKLLEPMYFAGENVLEEGATAMIVGKTYVGELYYLITTPENAQYIAPASAIEISPSATKYEYLEWFHNTFAQKAEDAERQFAFMTGKNAPSFEHQEPAPVPTPQEIDDQPGMPVEPEVAQAMEAEAEEWIPEEPTQPE
ncbi:hypothetical protein VPHD81_0081 [Vibrio phage D81]